MEVFLHKAHLPLALSLLLLTLKVVGIFSISLFFAEIPPALDFFAFFLGDFDCFPASLHAFKLTELPCRALSLWIQIIGIIDLPTLFIFVVVPVLFARCFRSSVPLQLFLNKSVGLLFPPRFFLSPGLIFAFHSCCSDILFPLAFLDECGSQEYLGRLILAAAFFTSTLTGVFLFPAAFLVSTFLGLEPLLFFCTSNSFSF